MALLFYYNCNGIVVKFAYKLKQNQSETQNRSFPGEPSTSIRSKFHESGILDIINRRDFISEKRFSQNFISNKITTTDNVQKIYYFRTLRI
jgi:hypothetical protein